MKLTKLMLLLAVTMSTTIQAQWWGGEKVKGNGDEVTITRTVNTYDRIKVKGALDVELVAGSEGTITLKGESNLLENIVTKVDNDQLKIYVEKGRYLKSTKGKSLKIIVPFSTLNEVTLSGSGEVISKDVIKAKHFEGSLSGSGELNLQIEAESVEGNLSGSGEIVLKGSCTDFNANLSGSGDIEAFELKASNADTVISGSGDIEVYATRFLKAIISGSGDIFYKGNPETTEKLVSGSGDITER
ncbi:head GIN domain-containing protein [Aquimarina brevivitae]|uniref:Putative autotransporter adhesin-like protein n=1 Tax=Aquimarina brevivitae TaxID=323412 RepID=A0A4Q7NU02_9FLAO|nr:head GIN domain-containing protein [Aquimarina brevivitae]RZS90651.1 putative autotransporter adhesin-like protein [Aquimarina brevivitae]